MNSLLTRNVTRAAALAAVALMAALGSTRAFAQANDILWGNTSPTGGDWSVGTNWPAFNAVPEAATFNEQAVINNGGLAFLTNTPAPVGGVQLGTVDADVGSLEIRSGGNLSVVDNGVTSGDVNVGIQNSTAGFLTVERGGTLSAQVLTTSAGGVSQLVIGTGSGVGAATVTADSAIFRSDVRLTNDAAVTVGELRLGGQSNLITEVSGAGNAAITVNGFADLNGAVTFEFDGVTPAIGSSWTVIDAGGITGARFANITSETALAPGLGYVQRVVDAGSREELVVSVDAVLTLKVNRATGAAEIVSESGVALPVTAYNLLSDQGSINPAYNTLEAQSIGGFQVAGTASATQAGELSPAGGVAIDGTAVSLGAAYAAPALPAFGTAPVDDLVFNYTLDSGETFGGFVEFDTDPIANNLVLTIDPATGDGRITNDSPTNLDLDVYSIASEASSLLTSWNSLADQGTTGWQEANPSTGRVSELNPTGSLALPAGGTLDLAGLWDTSATPDADDLTLEFRDTTLGDFFGIVEFATLVALPGDYNNDGAVNAADYTVWRDAGPTDVLANDATPGVVDVNDYAVWSANFGRVAAGSAAAVPEPTTLAGVVAGLLAALGFRRSRPACLPCTNTLNPRSLAMPKLTALAIAAIALAAGPAAAQPVDILAADVNGQTGAVTDGSITLTAFDNVGAVTDFGPDAAGRFFGPAAITNVNAINDVDGDPTTTDDGESMEIALTSGVSLTELSFAFTRVNPALFTGFGSDPLATLSSNPNGARIAYDDATGTLALYQDAFNGNATVISFDNPAASDGQTITVTIGDYLNAGPQFAFDRITYDPNPTTLLDGDVDGLNGVTIDDYDIIRANFFTNGGRADGDLTGDGFVSLVDFAEWETNFAGSSAGLESLLVAVPEPSAGLLGLSCLAALARMRRRAV